MIWECQWWSWAIASARTHQGKRLKLTAAQTRLRHPKGTATVSLKLLQNSCRSFPFHQSTVSPICA